MLRVCLCCLLWLVLVQNPDTLYSTRPATLLTCTALDVWPTSEVDTTASWALRLVPACLPGDEALLQHVLCMHVLAPRTLSSLLGLEAGDLRAALQARTELLPLLELCSYTPTGACL